MTVTVEMTAEVLLSGARRLAVRGTFEMVAVDVAGRPVPVPPSCSLDPVEEMLP